MIQLAPSTRLLKEAITSAPWRNLAALVCAAAHQVGEALVPVVIGYTIDLAIVPGALDRLIWWLAVLAVVFAVLSNSYLLHARLAERASMDAAVSLRLKLAAQLLDPSRKTDLGHSGVSADIASSDVDAVSRFNEAWFTLAAGLAGLTVAAVAMFRIDTVLGLLVVGGAIPVVAVIRALGGPFQDRLRAERAQAAAAAGTGADLLRGLRTIAGLGAQQTAARRFEVSSRAALDASLRSARFGALFGAVPTLVTGVFVATVAVAAGHFALEGRITVGALVAVLGLAQFVADPLAEITFAAVVYAEARASADRVSGQLSGPAAGRGTRRPTAGSAPALTVELGGRARLEIPPGELTCIAADPVNAAHVAAALRGMPDAPPATVAGTAIGDLDPAWLGQLLVVNPRAAAVFTGTIAENLASPTPAPYVEAAALAETVAALPDGLNSVVGESGLLLSGGERQRVALARALATQRPMLVLDEPTSAVDSVTETKIAEAVVRIRRGHTTVVLTTSPGWLAVAHRVIRIDQ